MRLLPRPFGNIGTIVPVSAESVIRPLSNLEPGQEREGWQKAVKTAPDGIGRRRGSRICWVTFVNFLGSVAPWGLALLIYVVSGGGAML
jgi:hypothetical protein